MRILILTQYFPPEIGAPQVRLAAMTRELKRLGHDVEVVTGLPNHPTGKIFAEYRGRWYLLEDWEGVPVHRVWLYPALGGGIKRLLNYLSFVGTSLIGLSRARRPDFIFVESPPLFLGIPGVYAAKRWGVPLVFNVADLWPDAVKDLGLMRSGPWLALAERIEAWCYQNATFVNAVTEGIQKTLIEKKKVPPEKILFLPNGADTDLFQPREPDKELAQELGLADKSVILYAGTIGYAHGLEVALEAMAIVRDKAPNATLVVIGHGSERMRLEALARQKGLDNVVFLPPRDPAYVARLFSVAVAGLVTLKDLPVNMGARPSKTFPIMASAKPVIYSGRGEGALLVEGARSGLVTPPEDPSALARAILFILEHPEVAKELGANGRKYVVENLSWNVLVRNWIKELEARLGKKEVRNA